VEHNSLLNQIVGSSEPLSIASEHSAALGTDRRSCERTASRAAAGSRIARISKISR